MKVNNIIILRHKKIDIATKYEVLPFKITVKIHFNRIKIGNSNCKIALNNSASFDMSKIV